MDRGNKDRWREIVKDTQKCPFCGKHSGENEGRRPKHKAKPKTRIRRKRQRD